MINYLQKIMRTLLSSTNRSYQVKRTHILTFILVVIVTSLCLSLFELGSYFYVKHSLKFSRNDPDIIEGLWTAIERMNHVRPIDYHNKYSSIDNLIFIENLATNSSLERPKLLIQGDSWVEQFRLYTESEILTERLRTLEEKWDVMYAGTSSYSPSVMTAQLDFLREVYDASPSAVVTIVDQSDFGDELCRYRDVRRKDGRTGMITVRAFDVAEGTNQLTFSQIKTLRYLRILSSNDWNSLKLIKKFYYHALGWIVKEKNCGWGKISQPLIEGLTAADKKYMIDVFVDYLRTAFRFESIKKIIFVTHPHLNHLNGTYKLEMGRFIDDNLNQIVKLSGVKFKVEHLSIDPPRDKYVYKANDPASHLTLEAHSSYFLTEIKSALEK